MRRSCDRIQLNQQVDSQSSVSDRQHNTPGHDGVSVIAPARLHLGFADLNGSRGRLFGSLGLGIEDLAVEVTATPADSIEVEGPAAARAADYAHRLLEHCRIDTGVRLQVVREIPEHAGLGSGTQLALAVGIALARLFDQPLEAADVAALLDRGARSGIGIGAFTHGGLIVDAGRGADTRVPPVVSRLHFPDAWRLILVFDPDCAGLSGPDERSAFEDLEPMDTAIADRISWLILMQALPAIAETDCNAFGDAVTRIQQHIGDHFAPVQGARFYSERVATAAQALAEAGAAGIGQSSWGPTGFALFPSETQAHQALREVRNSGAIAGGLTLSICCGRNRPAEISLGEHSLSQRQKRL